MHTYINSLIISECVDSSLLRLLQVTDHALAMTALHEPLAAPDIIGLAEAAVETGAPINRPIWWSDPTDQIALEIDSGKKRKKTTAAIGVHSSCWSTKRNTYSIPHL